MKKNIMRITMILLLLATMISLSACGSNTSNDSVEPDPETYNGFVIVSSQDISGKCVNTKYLTIMYDPDTLVMYSVTFGGARSATTSQLTPLYNADGTLKLILQIPKATKNKVFGFVKRKIIFFSSKEVSFFTKKIFVSSVNNF